jgi:hypothetical protein
LPATSPLLPKLITHPYALVMCPSFKLLDAISTLIF